MVEGEVSLDLAFSVAEDEYYFYLPSSFNITGSVRKLLKLNLGTFENKNNIDLHQEFLFQACPYQEFYFLITASVMSPNSHKI